MGGPASLAGSLLLISLDGNCRQERARQILGDAERIAVEIGLEDGRKLHGKLIVPPGRVLTELLNGSAAFVEFEPIGLEEISTSMTAASFLRCLQTRGGEKGSRAASGARSTTGCSSRTCGAASSPASTTP